MEFHQSVRYSSALEQAIDRNPFIVTPETCLAEVIKILGQSQNHCLLNSGSSLIEESRASCVLVVNQNSEEIIPILANEQPQTASVVGIITERDIVQLMATEILDPAVKKNLNQIRVAEIMSPISVSLTESDDQDIFTALSLFRQYQILHLPVLDIRGQLVGVITPERIRQVLQPANILRLRRVGDEMITQVITAPVTTSVLSLAQMMTAHQASYVVIFQAGTEKKLTPIGLVTEQDIVEAQFLELDLTATYATTVMRNLSFSLKINDSLWMAHQEMQKQQVQRLIVCGDEGELLGIITQVSLLRMLDPTEMYRVVKQLQQSVHQLQTEKLELLKSRNAELEKQVEERTSKVEELQQLNILKDDFLSTVSHELRTPLANMKMAIYMLKIAPNSERSPKYLEILESECMRETNLINDLLDLQRLESSAAPITIDSLDLLEWLPNIINPFYSRTQERNQVLNVQYYPYLQSIRTNSNSLERIVVELLNNACKYTPNGGEIFLGIHYHSLSNWLELIPTTNNKRKTKKQNISLPSPSISDPLQIVIRNPAEIPEQELPRIFEKFYRIPNADPWKQGGTGLGLALVQKLVAQLNGTIQVESNQNLTTFTIEFPC
ncbi:CBS domain-containing protein [Planktothrix agardhii 1029]|uniref:CBS domain-containing protein n=1 Tax=Planktothrix agardhii TaxID=1160 RepID=UPI001D09F586|nr:CBS domain-containing protein [Planktothrix agardhii]MCB8763838.1 CBS domain-containing protein [Planktothrix agardhii 1809]MCB8781895.1 CBS domain-containing protein [Planktothrix agardhii 1808]MCF3568549.1 CBS domain-containing protein [Planktothrix agardhii 1807]MCF3590251.1 CBS domain-containing protein [Planktothrix agardhii 1029]MCF3620283.1 CBS domain-containing protein [Planktothrix agardhii 1030]